jgi:hypothetical protein
MVAAGSDDRNPVILVDFRHRNECEAMGVNARDGARLELLD